MSELYFNFKRYKDLKDEFLKELDKVDFMKKKEMPVSIIVLLFIPLLGSIVALKMLPDSFFLKYYLWDCPGIFCTGKLSVFRDIGKVISSIFYIFLINSISYALIGKLINFKKYK